MKKSVGDFYSDEIDSGSQKHKTSLKKIFFWSAYKIHELDLSFVCLGDFFFINIYIFLNNKKILRPQCPDTASGAFCRRKF